MPPGPFELRQHLARWRRRAEFSLAVAALHHPPRIRHEAGEPDRDLRRLEAEGKPPCDGYRGSIAMT